jgi:hypothetical protein
MEQLAASFATLLALLASAGAGASEDERSCERALALANDGRLAALLQRPAPPVEGDEERLKAGDPERWGSAAGSYTLERGDGTKQRLLAVSQGGTCHSTGLARDDGVALELEPLVEADENFGLDTVPLRIDGEWYALAFWHDRWRFTPLALGRLEAQRLVPLCRFGSTGEVRREAVAPADPVCSAFLESRIDHVDWQPVDDDEIPASPLPAHDASRAELEWRGLGPRTTWKLLYESAAGCGMKYEWLALDASTPDGNALDTASATGRALFPEIRGEKHPNGPWWLDGVFVYDARTWFAGQPQWGDTDVGDYAVYRVDAEGLGVQCRYRHLPQFRIERGAPVAGE